MKINKTIVLLVKIYALVLSVFSVFRLILFFSELDRVNFAEVDTVTILQSFIMGIRFDAVISGYVLLLPALVLLVFDLFSFDFKVIKRISFYWIFILFSICFSISAADIPYFNHFYDRFSIGAFQWIENLDFVVSMIVQEPKYFLTLIPFILLEWCFYKGLNSIFYNYERSSGINIFFNTIVTLLFLLLMILGIRGRVEIKSPIRVGTAYFSDNSFLNKLGLNPVFTLMRSYIDQSSKKNKAIDLMDNKLAIKKVQTSLGIDTLNYNSPIARDGLTDFEKKSKPNIVLIIMESMSAGKMTRHGNTQLLTPFLDSLSEESLYFDNIYTTGKHTFNGVFSTLFSFPAIYRQHPMKIMREYYGMSHVLRELGYSTTYFTTHDGQFDNVEGFLKANAFQNVISESDYPKEEVKTTLGVPDDYMFRYAIPYINNLAKNEEPFFVSFMTASDHGPYYIPEYFRPSAEDIKSQIVQYADWSLRQFINSASKEKWYNNTVFVFIADHGAPLGANYDIALNYFHTPLIVHRPSVSDQDGIYSGIGSQMDVFPTILGLTNQKYINNTLGVDLLNTNRKYTIINDDDKIGILDSTYFCIMRDNGNDLKLYDYRHKNKSNIFNENIEKSRDMADYAKSQMQTYQNMMLNGKISLNTKRIE